MEDARKGFIMKALKTEYIVVSTGAGGPMTARELARAGKELVIVEQGSAVGFWALTIIAIPSLPITILSIPSPFSVMMFSCFSVKGREDIAISAVPSSSAAMPEPEPLSATAIRASE